LEEGERVNSQDKIISLIDTASLYAMFPVRERDALRIGKGMTASVLVDGTGETKNAVVDLVYPQADSQSLSFLVRVLLQDTETADATRLRPGMFARVTINLGVPEISVFIPETAIINKKNNEGSVFIINGSVLTERKIVFGISHGEEREITAGLNAGELVVLRPEPDLREGTNVTIVQ
jgi:RND family efflux transporter MFP subunit